MAPWVIVSTCLAAGLCLTGALTLRPPPAPAWLAWTIRALASLALVAVLDAACSRIVLDPEELQIRGLLQRRRFAREEFLRARLDGGSVFLERRGGGWLKLPDTGRNGQGVFNSVRAWLSHQPTS
jgi:hypothetical protein